jgi:hypothetical protein
MAAKLKGLKITSTDLVGQGANPDAYVRMFKRKGSGRPVAAREVYMRMRKIAGEIDDVLKSRDEAKTFDENIEREKLQKVTSEMYDFCCAFSDSLWSIIDDTEQDEIAKRDMNSWRQFATQS